MRILLVLGVVGQLVQLFAGLFVVPIAMAVFDHQHESAVRFLISGLLTFAAGMVLSRGFRRATNFRRAEAFGVVAFTWAAVAMCAAIPYWLYDLAPADALFESMSGFTTTGATILRDFSLYDRAFYLWRAMTQWLGGLGVIALFVVVLPRLGIAGRQLFFAEASGAPSEAVSPQVRKSAQKLWILYIAMTAVLTTLLMVVSGFSLFEAITHAFTTMAAGGFSPHPESIMGYHSPSAEWILSLFMLLSGASFPLLYNAFTRRPSALLHDGEFLFYSGIMLSGAVALSLILAGGIPTLETLRLGAFQAASMMSSTGFASTDFNLWPDSAKAVLIVVMLVGGCAGSAAGGPKSVRLLLVFKHVLREITKTLHPRSVLSMRYKGAPVDQNVMRSVFMLVVLFMLGHFVFGTVLVLLGSDLVLGYSAALACLGNIGPGFGAAGPMGSFAGFSVAAKLMLTFAMWLGRLEIVAVLALFHWDVLGNLKLR
jgi:trk system potassium uptake protein TrkH